MGFVKNVALFLGIWFVLTPTLGYIRGQRTDFNQGLLAACLIVILFFMVREVLR